MRGEFPRNTVYWAGSGAFSQVCRAEGTMCSSCSEWQSWVSQVSSSARSVCSSLKQPTSLILHWFNHGHGQATDKQVHSMLDVDILLYFMHLTAFLVAGLFILWLLYNLRVHDPTLVVPLHTGWPSRYSYPKSHLTIPAGDILAIWSPGLRSQAERRRKTIGNRSFPSLSERSWINMYTT